MIIKVSKKHLLFIATILFILSLIILSVYIYSSRAKFTNTLVTSDGSNITVADIQEEVIPANGFQTKISLKDSILKLIQNGVIDKTKFENLYSNQGGLPDEFKNVLTKESNGRPIPLTQKNSGVYLNLLWALGLSNYLKLNEKSPINGADVDSYASTGGWTLGKADSGGVYFNKFNIVSLTPEEEKTVVKIAESIYRPCCNNSSFFQDCNHGSALFGMLQLGISQGLSEDVLYKEALAFNSFWFPNNYIQTAQYFKIVKNTNWNNVDPRIILSKDYSSITGWNNNIGKVLSDKGITPPATSAPGCSV